MKPILVSIIIPCYNVEEYIAECIASVLGQTYRPIEVIIVDNNSTDDTMVILKDYEKKFPEHITVVEEKKQGAPAARNKGMTVAKGRWFQFLDADDLLLPNKIKHQVEKIKDLITPTIVVGGNSNQYLDKKILSCKPEAGDVFKALVYSNLGYTGSNLFKNLSPNIQPQWDEALPGSQDTWFIFEYIKKGKHLIVYDFDCNTITRERPHGQITTSNPIEFENSCYLVRARILDFVKVNHPVYYKRNSLFFLDCLYYFIYRIGIVNPASGHHKLMEVIPKGYIPNFRRNNKISFIHTMGWLIFGFKSFVKIRSFLLKSISL